MDTCSYFIINKALFGSSPTQEIVESLEKMGVRYFVDLTVPNERGIYEYMTRYKKITYPIKDFGIPIMGVQYITFIKRLCNIINSLQEGEKIYVHCKGGHGRCGVVVASILCMYYRIDSDKSLQLTNNYHKDRKTMREKWRIIGSPQTFEQKRFVGDFYKSLIAIK